jgi:hypothetical protein
MTNAVCLRCGAQKHGAWVPCRKCGFSPSTAEEKAKAVALSDHYLSAEDLQRAGETIASGEELKVAGEGFDNLLGVVQETDSDTKGCQRAFLIVVGVIFLLAVTAALLYVFW